MHERYLISQSHEQPRQRLSSNTSSSNSSNSSSNSAVGEETEGLTEADDSKKKRSNGNPSPPPCFYGNLLSDDDHLLPLQHYILQQAKLSGATLTMKITVTVILRNIDNLWRLVQVVTNLGIRCW